MRETAEPNRLLSGSRVSFAGETQERSQSARPNKNLNRA